MVGFTSDRAHYARHKIKKSDTSVSTFSRLACYVGQLHFMICLGNWWSG